MKILLSCFACTPEWGSEPGVGWRWALELAKSHQVTVITHAYFQGHIDAFARAHPDVILPAFHYVGLEAFGLHPHTLLNSRLYYTAWQMRAYFAARQLPRDFDVVHHLTWGTYRFPSFMGYLGMPFVKGPLGGGERSPMRLLPRAPRKAFLFEVVRTALIHLSRFDPFVWISNCSADLLLCKTRESISALPGPARKRAVIAAEIGATLTGEAVEPKNYAGQTRFRLFFAGRLISCKGLHLAIRALARLRAAGVDAELVVAGDGEMRPALEALAQAEGMTGYLTFLGALPREQLLGMYREMDLFLFPSLHDSSGNVLLESMSVGLPVVCLDLGGPPYFVNESCGRVVATGGRSEETVCMALAETLASLLRDPEGMNRLSAGAIARCRELTWSRQVDTAYGLITQHLKLA